MGPGSTKDIAQSSASWMQELAEAQDLQGKEALLADIIKEEMVHQTQVSILSQVYLQQADEIQVYSEEIKHLSALLERQQAILEQVQEQQLVSLKSLVLSILQHGLRNYKRSHSKFYPTLWIPEAMQALNTFQDIVKIFWLQGGTSSKISWLRRASQQHPHHEHFATGPKGRLTSTPEKHHAEVRESNVFLPHKKRKGQC